ncbi:DUF1941 family protein [Drepanopeziza brunnea f. sp. 'multigermtubi' MB_m1]|uniref:DUF1941 family protein n=1 Tax=Marssonina brunnea f. sp. multigermtubi (strain MB_m1) TaxID=1072389 RepID=K1XKZ1_MARBU|nr:DUF1941 family protein [Drepanopeziza brunnea f. sp. 'multigermtubi' MB_m1]EKD21253.1 DUF1941 family protein [Drepanopeziza brunnea f. sp. 'multigermtubi' MB_m1]
MAETAELPKGMTKESLSQNECPATFEKMQDLLKAKDDTSRFVGLALLKSVLDNGQLVQDPQRLRILWEAMSPKFLDRLLRAHYNNKVNKSDSKDMVDLAVSVLHTFSILLPEESRREKRLTGRTAPLVKALIQSPPETTKLILQTLLTIVSHPEGALEMLAIEDLSPLIEITNQYPLALEIFEYGWTRQLIIMLRKLVANKPTAAGRAAYTHLAAALLQAFPATCPPLLFKDDSSGNPDSKPFSYLLVNLLLIDIRSSFPTLLEKLNTVEYPSISQRLAAAFDVVSSFIGFLVRSLDDQGGSGFSMTPDLLLKLRKDIAETMSINIEYLRDRWDASVAGASGLHPSARTGTAATSEGTRLTLTWDSMKDEVNADPLILAGIRALAIWIREDENENLRNETAGLMDMLVELYSSSLQGALDFRYPILLALEGIVVAEEGLDRFLGQEGWQVLFRDLKSILKTTSDKLTAEGSAADAGRGLQIVRVLLGVVDHDATSLPREDWMAVVTTATSMKVPAATALSVIIEFQIAMLQLSAALLAKSSGGMTKRFVSSRPALSGLVRQLKSSVGEMDDEAESAEFMVMLDDVELDLGHL